MSWILTYTGRRFDPINPDPEQIDPVDIAHALSHMCRFNGHCRHFYSVAQHSVLVSQNVPDADALAGLLHDASEAYIADITRPVKPHLTNYHEIEQKLQQAIAERFGIEAETPSIVKYADVVLLATEKRDLMPEHPDPWPVLDAVPPLDDVIEPWSSAASKMMFLNRLECLEWNRE